VSQAPTHIPVLVQEVLRHLAPGPGETFVDCTAGLGGHAAAIAPILGPAGAVVLNDVDAAQLELARSRVEAAGAPGSRPRVITLRGNFADLPRRLTGHQPPIVADLVLADLGFSSAQMDDPARGLSFMRDGPLDMRLDPGLATTAADLVSTLPEHELERLIREFGEDRKARWIARKLVAAREQAPIQTTGRLAEVARAAAGRSGGIDGATRTFQALRIAVNDELGSLQAFLEGLSRGAGGQAAAAWLNKGARVAVISFHSLEDRLIKRAFADLVERGAAAPLTKRPVTAGAGEVESNPRARSAKLRALRLLP
jgi:16S rRNA (cytosine1402-N4)-methyltransferase